MEHIRDIGDKMKFLDKVVMLRSATSDNDSPVPGYLYREICAISYSSGSSCSQLTDFLVERLENKSSNVMIKVLKIMKFVTENGHPTFSDELKKNASGIQEALKHGGRADSLLGNTPYVQVREAAKSLLTVLFDTDRLPRNTEPSGGMSAAVGSVGSGGMQGMGYTVPREKSVAQSLVSGLQDFVENINTPNVKKPLNSSPDIHFSSYEAVEQSNMTPITPVLSTAPIKPQAQRVKGRVHVPGRPGGGWDDSDSDNEAVDQQGSNHSNKSTGSNSTDERLLSAGSDEAEYQLVNQFTDSEKMLPSRNEITQFMTSCVGLNCEKVIEAVNIKLSQENDAECMRSLLLLESFLRKDLVTADDIAMLVHKNLLGLYHNTLGPIQVKAKKIIRILERISSQGELFIAAAPRQNES